MGAPIKEISFGKVKAAVWEGDYQGKKTYSVTLNKSYLKDNKWNNSNYFTTTDLRDLYILVGSMLSKNVKERVPGNQTQQNVQNAQQELNAKPADDAVSFTPGNGDIPF